MPPLLDGAVHLSLTLPLPGVAVKLRGVLGVMLKNSTLYVIGHAIPPLVIPLTTIVSTSSVANSTGRLKLAALRLIIGNDI